LRPGVAEPGSTEPLSLFQFLQEQLVFWYIRLCSWCLKVAELPDKMHNLRIKILIITLIAAGIPIVFLLFVYFGAFGILQNKGELLSYKNAAASMVLSQEGDLIGKIFTENRTNITYGQIPSHMINELIVTEDVRFYEHKGIDARSFLRVLFKSVLFKDRSAGGGSTITQQLAKNMFGRKNNGPFAILINKTKEVLLARRLEKVFRKEEIITLYLNTVSFGENVFGIEAASRRYFNKKVDDLKIEESAVLIGILKANSLYNPRMHPTNARNRRNVILSLMQKFRYLEESEADSLRRLPLILNYSTLETEGTADYFLYQVKNEAKQILLNINAGNEKKWNIEEDGLIITTTLNISLQNIVNKSFHDHLAIMQKKLNEQFESNPGKKFIEKLTENELARLKMSERANFVELRKIFDWSGSYSDSISVADSLEHSLKLLHAGFLAMDPLTGAIKAWVGGIDFKTQPYDQILAHRQMGSTFKPILYAEALEEGIKPCYYLDNDSIIISGFEQWKPENFDHSYGGKYSLAGALVHSMNLPTINLFLKVSFGSLDSLWRKMGFSYSLIDNPSLAMGTSEANIMEVTLAYSTFANGGFKITPQKIVSIKSPDGDIIWQNEFSAVNDRVLTERVTRLMCAILQNVIRKGTGSPLGSVYGINLPVAGKTGTTQDYADAWFVAFNPGIVMVSRVGASLPSVHFTSSENGTGSALALPLVALTLKQAEMNPRLKEQLVTPFPKLTPELEMELDCPDYREKNVFENVIGIFKKNKLTYNQSTGNPEPKKQSFFKRIFGKKNKVRHQN
jgi:penicillin-binding protein 1A